MLQFERSFTAAYPVTSHINAATPTNWSHFSIASGFFPQDAGATAVSVTLNWTVLADHALTRASPDAQLQPVFGD